MDIILVRMHLIGMERYDLRKSFTNFDIVYLGIWPVGVC